MPREPQPFKREYRGDVVININDIFRNPDIQEQVIKNIKKIKRKSKTK